MLSIEREVFFSFSKKKLQIKHPYEGGEEKFIFQNQLFGLLVVRTKIDFFPNPYRRLRVKKNFDFGKFHLTNKKSFFMIS